MAGLLDLLGSDTGLLGLQLMAAGSAKPVKTGFGEGLLGALQNVQAQRVAEEEKRQRAAMQQLQMKLLGAQVDETQAQAQQRQATARDQAMKAQRAQQFQNDLLSGMQGMSPQQALADGGGPTPQAAARIGSKQPIDWQALAARYPEHIDQLSKIAAAADMGRPEVARTLDVAGAGGMPETVQLDKFGQRVGSGMPKAVEMKLQDLGGKVSAYNPFQLQAGQGFDKTNTPDALLSAQTAMRGQNMTDARSREANSIANTTGKPPAGYRWKADGTLEAIPGGPADQKVGGPGAKVQDAKDVLEILDMAEPLLKKSTGSYAGAGLDILAGGVGYSTKGAQAAAELKALQGALVSKMPKMSGPQSDKDVQLYREMAGQIGDSTLPVATRQAAVRTIRLLNEKYAGAVPDKQSAPSVDDLLKKYGN